MIARQARERAATAVVVVGFIVTTLNVVDEFGFELSDAWDPVLLVLATLVFLSVAFWLFTVWWARRNPED